MVSARVPDKAMKAMAGRADQSLPVGNEGAGVVVVAWPLEAAQWPAWIRRRMEAKGLKPGPGVVDLLAHLMEGNLLACAQEIDKFSLRFGGGEVGLDDIEDNLGDNARYNVFALADASLRGEPATVERILTNLRGEGVEPILVLWALTREARFHLAVSLAFTDDEQSRAIEPWAASPDRRFKVIETLARAADAQLRAGDKDAARATIAKALEKDPENQLAQTVYRRAIR